MISQSKIILCRFVPAMFIALVISGAPAGSTNLFANQQAPTPIRSNIPAGMGAVLVTNKYDGPLNISIKGPGIPEQTAQLLPGGGVYFFLPPGSSTISYSSTRLHPQASSDYSSDHVDVTITKGQYADPITFGGKTGTWHGQWIIKGNWTGPISIRFDDSGESGWTQAQKNIVREAMKEWTDAGKGLIQFTEVSYNANLNLKWENPPSNTPVHVALKGALFGEMTGGTSNQSPTGIAFNPNTTWYFDDDPTSDKPIPADKVDFLSVAKHELGHALGLHHADVGAMHATIDKGERHRLDPIDLQAVAIHYPDTQLTAAQTTPTPAPSTPQIGLRGLVGDVTLTGLPPNETVFLTNAETKERIEQRTDSRGFVRIPLTEKKWPSGMHSVTCHVDGKPVTSKIFLRDGANRIDLTALTYSVKPLDPAKAQRVDEALKKSSAALKADPKNSQALLTQGAAFNRLDRHGEALAQLARATKMGSTDPALAFEIGWSLMELGMYPEAIAQLEKYEKMRPGLGQTSEFIGRSYLFLNELDKADAKLKEALQRDPKLASTVRFHQAILETLRKNPEAAAKYIDALLKEAPNSATAQLFKNALLQAPGTGAAAKDYKLSDPIRIQLPPTTAGDVAGAVAKGVVGGVLGGLFGGGRRDEPSGPNLVAKPVLPETPLTSKDGKTKINLSGAIEDGKPYVVMGVKESPGNGVPHLIMLQDKNCNVLQPKETSVTGIWEQWGGWKITVSWTKSYYENGRLVRQEKGGYSTPWNIFHTQIKDPGDIPGIWKDFGGKPFGETREVMSSFEPPPESPFNPADWNLITHATTDAGNNQILTAPFVTGLGTDQKNNLTFTQRDQTVCESTSTPPLLASNPITFPWTVGPYALTITPDPTVSSGSLLVPYATVGAGYDTGIKIATPTGGLSGAELIIDPKDTKTETRPDGTKVETRPDGTQIATYLSGLKIERRPDGTMIETYPGGSTAEWHPDGTKIATHSDGVKVEYRPDGTQITTYLSGLKIERRPDGTKITSFPDGSSVKVGKDGSIEFTDPPPKATQVKQPQDTQVEQPTLPPYSHPPGLEDKAHASTLEVA